MANRRILKKNINYICSELVAECMTLSLYKKDVKQEDVDNILSKILMLRDDFVCRISHTEPGNAQKFYAQLQKEFNGQVNDIIDAINERC